MANSIVNHTDRFPSEDWDWLSPDDAGVTRSSLEELESIVGGRGCVVRHGCMVYAWGDQSLSSDVASAFKPLLSTLLLIALQEGLVHDVNDAVAELEPALRSINGGKDAAITWLHLASQTSGYGLTERPGEAYSYNDYALALYSDLLIQKVFNDQRTSVLVSRLAAPLGFEDPCSLEAFGPGDRPGRLAVSVRDFARFGLMYLRNGRWGSAQIVREDLVRMALTTSVPPDMPFTEGRDADMLPGQRTIGGGKNINGSGPGHYSFNWWINRSSTGALLYPALPPDTYQASGHGSRRSMICIPSLDLIVVWNEAKFGRAPGKAPEFHRALHTIGSVTRDEPICQP